MNPQQFFPVAGCIQLPIQLGDAQANLAQLQAVLADATPHPGGLFVLPELWASGFDYEQTLPLAQQTPELVAALVALAKEYAIYLAGSFAQLSGTGSRPFNLLHLVGPHGPIASSAKRHLFRFWREDQFYQAGMEAALPLATPHGPVGAAICYDLRFPELMRNQVFAGCGLIMLSAQWPLSRLDHWRSLVRARAIENQCYLVAANGCQVSGKMELAGHSMIVAPDGAVLAEAGAQEACIISAHLDIETVAMERARFCPVAERPWFGDDAEKICTLSEAVARIKPMQAQGSRIAFTNGCFDLLHAGHVSYLQEARRSADYLVVGLNSDHSVRLLNKGPGRPVNAEQDRARVLAALGVVDCVIFFDDPTPLALIEALGPQVLVKGADWAEDAIVGAAQVKAAGGEVRRIAFTHACSTSALIARIKQEKVS